MDQIQTVDETRPEVEQTAIVPSPTGSQVTIGQIDHVKSPHRAQLKQDLKWQRLLAKSDCQPTATKAVDFFTSPTGFHYSDDDEDDSLGQTACQDVRSTVDDGPSHLSTRYQPAFYYPTSWTGLVTISSQMPVSLEEKLEDVTELWSPEEDGLYVGQPPKCARHRWRILERRLVTHAADKTIKTKWFRTDGTVAVLPDPLRPYLVRNIISTMEPRPVYLMNGKMEKDGLAGVQLDRAYPLHLFVSGLFFDHHWLFGQENVVAGRLHGRWQTYSMAESTTETDHPSAAAIDVLARKLGALYQAHDEAVELLDRLQFNGADAAVMAAQFQRIASYREAIGWTRGDYYTANGRRLANIRSMLSDWKELKALRQSQGFAATNCQLVVRKMKTSGAAQLDWDEEIERQMDESRRLFQEHVRSDVDRYKRQKTRWKEARKKRRDRKKKRASSSAASTSSSSSPDSREAENDDENQTDDADNDDDRPEAPPDREFDEVQTRADIVRVMQESLTPPGEKQVKLSWATIASPPQATDNAREHGRIEAIKKCVYQLKILINQEEASVSDVFHLTQEFKADDIQQAFHLWIRDKPRNITIQLFYKNNANHKKWFHLADVAVPIPSPRMSFANQPESHLKFQSALVHPAVADLGTVGCGLKQQEDEIQWTNGVIVLKSGWGTDAQGNVIAPNHLHQPIISKQAQSSQWINHFQLDPNDPANAETLDKIEKMKRLERKGSNGKSVGERVPDEVDTFCSREQLDSNVRFELLRRRADEVKPFGHLTMVPSRPDEIPNHLAQILDGSAVTGSSLESNEDQDNLNPLDAVRRRGQRKLLKIYLSVADRLSSTSQKRLQLADLVMEDHIEDMSEFRGQLMPVFFKAHRPLRPERKEKNPVPLLAGLVLSTTEQVSLRVNIIRALNLPNKIDHSEIVHPFVEVSFQKSSARTTAGNGCSPTWNQELALPVNFQDGVRSLAYLQSIRDDLFIQLFDEVVVDILDDDRQRDVSVHQRYERHWLGGLKIPFQVVYKWSKVEGTFALNLPLVPIGYQYNHSNQDGPLLTVLISIYPAVSHPRANQNNGASLEDQALVEYVIGWRDGLVKEFPSLSGVINPLVVNEQAVTVYVGRYLTRLEPPDELSGSTDDETLRNLCQFVASIPSASNNQPALLPRIWLTCQSVLDWLVGGDEERAVLLHNYMASLHYDVYVLLGMAIPEGETAYVLYKEKTSQTMRMINPSTGLATNVSDPTTPMQQVWAIFNQNDYWVNIHPKIHPSQLQYQVAKSSDWRPLFSRRFANPKSATVQNAENLSYPATDAKYVSLLEESIIDHLKQSFMKWRKTIRTKWNRHAGQVFRDILAQAAKGAVSPTSDNLQELLETYKVFGVPLKTAYVNLESLSDLLYATGLHRHQGIEFALSVYIKSYPNHLLHVFIFGAYLENL